MASEDDLWDALGDLFGEFGLLFVPLGVLIIAVIAEVIYHLSQGTWWVP